MTAPPATPADQAAPLAAAARLIGRGLGLAALLSLACNLGALVVPLFNMELFNRVLPTRNLATLGWLCAVLVLGLALYAALDHLRAAALTALGNRLSRRLAVPLLDAVAALPLSGAVPRGAPLHDLERLRGFLASPVCVAPLDLLWTPVLLGVLLVQHWAYAALGGVCALALLALNLAGDVATRRHLLAASHAGAQGLRDVAGAVRAAEAVLAMGMLPALARRWELRQQAAAAAAGQAMLRSRTLAALTRTLRLGATGAMVALGLVLVLRGEASSGSMVAGNMILARLLLPFEQFSATQRQWIEALASWQRLRAVLDMRPAERYRAALPSPRGGLQVERLVYIPPGGDRPVLRGVSFALAPGEVLGVIGPSGAGKTSLLRLVLGMAAPTAGGAFLDGHNCFLWQREDFARHVGYLPQSLALVDGTVADNIARMGPPDLARVRAAARLAGAHAAIAALPDGYATRVAGFTLSSGQRQRIALARALYGGPRLLVLDEPSAFLDRDGEAALAGLLARLRAEGTSVLLATHRPALIGMADTLLVLQDGLIERHGKRAEVLAALDPAPAPLPAPIPRAPAVREAVS